MKGVLSFIVPKKYPQPPADIASIDVSDFNFTVSVVIPSYKPTNTLRDLVHTLLKQTLVTQVIIVDDATPKDQGGDVFDNIQHDHANNTTLTIIHNERNLLCADAINRGLVEIQHGETPYHSILILNDDAKLETRTIEHMCLKLWSRDNLGAVCTQARVLNAKKNLVTRLQRLEYLSFNIARKADEGFLKGPLIMPGLATMFRSTILLGSLKVYDSSCLIEDYEMTVRLKKHGWEVALADQAIVWTIVPETFKQLLRQRVRWYYGGLTVLRRHWNVFSATLPDMISHMLNVGLLVLIILSFVVSSSGPAEPDGYFTLRGVLLSFGIFGLLLNIVLMLWLDSEKDWIDILLRCTLITEIYYQTFLSYVIFGSYFFYAYQSMKKRLIKKFSRLQTMFQITDRMFKLMGFTTSWGTK